MKSYVMQKCAAWSLSKPFSYFGWHSTASSKNLMSLYFRGKHYFILEENTREENINKCECK